MPCSLANITNTIMAALCSHSYGLYAPEKCWSLAGWGLISAGKELQRDQECDCTVEDQLIGRSNHDIVFLSPMPHTHTNLGA